MKKSSSQGSFNSEISDSSVAVAKVEPQDGSNYHGESSVDGRDFDAISDAQSINSYSSNTNNTFNYKQKKYQIELNIKLLYVSDPKYFG